MKQLFTFRELDTPEEMLQSLRLRYEIYSQCHLKTFLHLNHHTIDADGYDEHSRHYGLYQNNILAGYIRVILPKNEFQNHLFIKLKEDLLASKALDPDDLGSNAPYPYLSYSGLPESYWQHYQDMQSFNYHVVEGGRLVIKPEFRDMRISKFLLECVFTVYFLLYPAPGNAVVTCCKEHYKFYSYYGFRPINEGDSYSVNGNQIISVAIPIPTKNSIPNHLLDRFSIMATEYSSTGKIEFHP